MKKIDVHFSWGAVILFTIFIISDALHLFIPLAIAAAVHEAGHVAAIYILGGRVTSVCISIGGINIGYDTSSLSYVKELICILSGPAFGLAAAIIASRLDYMVFSGMSFAFSVFNMLPARPLDGGQAVSFIALQFCSPYTSEKLCTVIDMIIMAAIIIGGIWIAYVANGNLTLLFMGIVMVICYCNEYGNSIKLF